MIMLIVSGGSLGFTGFAHDFDDVLACEKAGAAYVEMFIREHIGPNDSEFHKKYYAPRWLCVPKSSH